MRAFEDTADVLRLERGQRHRRLRYRPASRVGGRHYEMPALGDNHRSLDHIAKFAGVAGPGIALQVGEAFLRYRIEWLAIQRREFVDEAPDKHGNVFDAVAQRRQDDGKNIQAVEEILAKRLVA